MSRRAKAGRVWPFVLAAAAVFALLATLPIVLPVLHLQLEPTAAKTSHGVTLLPAPRAPSPVSLSKVAQPIDADLPWSALPSVDTTTEAAAVSAEDARIRVMLHDAGHIYDPEVIPTRGALPTLVLTAGQGPYTVGELVEYGAMVLLPDNTALLLDNIFVSTNATLDIGGDGLRALYMDDGSGGFATIVAWGGNLAFKGTDGNPLTIMGWDRATSSPAADLGSGRSYIREVGGRMTLNDIRASYLGFWSGRTGGVAWTGLLGKPSKGSATSSTFTDDTYGAFISRGNGVTFDRDLFEFNELDGLHIHRYSVNSSVIASSATRNGGNGFTVSPATQNTVLSSDVSEHNAGNGYFVDGRPIATGASASGGSVAPGSGTVIRNSAALNNGQIGILVEGGSGTVVEADQVCSDNTAVAVKENVTDAVVTGNYLGCDPRTGLSIGPAVPGLTLSGNTVAGPRIGILVNSSDAVEVDNNTITGARVFGITARGSSSQLTGVGNVISGTGFRAVDNRADASAPALSGTNDSAWIVHTRVTFFSYLAFHPLAALWLSVAILLVAAWAWSRRRRLPPHPYETTTRWRETPSNGAVVPERQPAFAVASSVTDPFPVLTDAARPDFFSNGLNRRDGYNRHE
jgi:parallel beta helix pectate lyase-like protein